MPRVAPVRRADPLPGQLVRVLMLDYFLAHWRGELSLAKSIFVNGLLAYFVLITAIVGAGQVLASDLLIYFGIAVFFAWEIWALVGISRYAIKFPRSGNSSLPQKIFAVVALVGVLTAVVVTINDILSTPVYS